MLKRYNVPKDKAHEGWAIIVIDTDIGFFSTVSDWGNYSFLWTHPGGEFRKFLIGLEPDYLHGKLMHGRPNHAVFDAEKTKAAILDAIEEHNKDWQEEHGVGCPTYADEKELLEEHSFEDEGSFEAWEGRTTLTDVWEYRCYIPEPQCRSFCDRVMPRFKKMLEEELAKEEQDKKTAEALRAAGPQLVADLRAELIAEFPIPLALK